MTILGTNIYRDGGTVLIETDQGNFWIARPKSEDRWPRKGTQTGEHASKEEVIDLISSLASDSSQYHWIKNRISK